MAGLALSYIPVGSDEMVGDAVSATGGAGQLDLDDLPRPGDPDFGPRIRRLDMTLAHPESDFRGGLANTAASVDQRFACLYGLLTRLRREYRYDEYRELVRASEREFGAEPNFRSLQGRNCACW